MMVRLVGVMYAKTNQHASMDVIELIKVLIMEIPTLESSPLYLVGKSMASSRP
jgi:hypothetical protein